MAAPTGQSATIRNAHVLGRLDSRHMAALLGRAAVFALPARYEPFGLSVLEAALSGCALVLGDIPSLRENWDGAAEFVPPNSDEALVSALDRLAESPAHRKTLALAAIDRARRFTPHAMAESYLDAYRRAAVSQQPIESPMAGLNAVLV